MLRRRPRMTEDLKEFEELWNRTDEAEFTHNSYEYHVGKYYWLAACKKARKGVIDKWIPAIWRE